jgi:uncharacterized protein DUF5666
MKQLRISLAAVVALLLMAGCGSIGNVLGTGSPNPANTQSISGTVNNVDLNARRIDISPSNNSTYVTSVYWDNSTQFTYQNQNVNPNSLRRGDYVNIQAFNNNGQYVAQNVYDTGSGMASGSPAPNPSTNSTFDIQGTVNYVDTTAQRIDLTSAYTTGLRTNGTQGSYSVYYGTQTPVYYQGQTYSPTALERGDQIDVRAFDNGNGRYMADTITVTRNVRGQ